MGVFLLTAAPQDSEADARSVSRDFGPALRLATPFGTLRLQGKLNGQATQIFQADSTGFAACTGIFFYRGLCGTEALRKWLEDFDGRRMNWGECHGHFALVARRGGRLWLATDALGAYKIYHDEARRSFSSSFSEICAQQENPEVDAQGLYEYVWNGACYGTRTFVRGVRMLRSGGLHELQQDGRLDTVDSPALAPVRKFSSADEAAAHYAERLERQFRLYAASGRKFRSALSGGYDSRLMLAAMLKAGISPDLFVYGRATDEDVVVARMVAEKEGLALRHIDKQHIPAEDVATRTAHAARVFDGWNNSGIFDSGADAFDRLSRARDQAILLNGSVGEVTRNFFYLRDREYGLRDVVWSFYSRHDPKAATGRFKVREFEDAMIEDMAAVLGCSPSSRLARAQVEMLYPLHRGRYWTGRDVGLNQRFGDMLFPFMEWSFFDGTQALPVAWKNCGEFESRIIAHLHPRLATYMSAYGFAPDQPPTTKYRLKMNATLARPTWLRRYSFRLQMARRKNAVHPDYLAPATLARVMTPGWPKLGDYFRPEFLHDEEAFNRLCTAEYFLQNAGARAASPLARETVSA